MYHAANYIPLTKKLKVTREKTNFSLSGNRGMEIWNKNIYAAELRALAAALELNGQDSSILAKDFITIECYNSCYVDDKHYYAAPQLRY